MLQSKDMRKGLLFRLDATLTYLRKKMNTNIETRVIQIISEVAMKTVSLDEPLFDSGLIDSILAVDLALRIESDFNCPIPPQEITEHMASPRALISYVTEHC